MNESEFWTIIEEGGTQSKGDQKRQVKAVRKRLAQSSREEVLDFNCIFNQELAAAYTWNLWGAAYLINGGCSDDGFHYFRGWLISLGRFAFDAAVHKPDSLARLVDPKRSHYEFENLCSVAFQAWRELTGEEEMPHITAAHADPVGERWDFDNDEQVKLRLPELARLYITEPKAPPRRSGK